MDAPALDGHDTVSRTAAVLAATYGPWGGPTALVPRGPTAGARTRALRAAWALVDAGALALTDDERRAVERDHQPPQGSLAG